MAATRGQPGTKPTQLDAPVPGAATKSAVDDFFESDYTPPEVAAAPAGTGDQFFEPEAPQAAEPAAAPQEQSGLGKAVDYGIRALDYPGGHVRTALATAAGAVTGTPNITTDEDIKNAIKGKAPESAEYLRRLGVPEGGSAQIPGLGRVTLRGATGLALDIATDPLTAVGKLAKEVPYIAKLIGAPGKASEAVGEAIYKSGLKKVDAKLAAKGEAPVSDILLAEGKAGTTAKIAKDVEQMSQTMGKVRQGLYDKATELGVSVNIKDAKFARAEAVLMKMRRDPNLKASADELEAMINNYKQTGTAPIDVVSEWKTSLYDSLPQSAYEGPGKLKGTAKQFKAALAGDLRQMIVDTGNKAEKGLGDGINAINDKWGTLLNAKRPLGQQAQQAEGKAVADWIDATILGGGITQSPMATLAALGGKKLAQAANTTYARTKFGKALVDAGRSGIVDAATRRALIKYNQSNINPPMALPPEEPVE